MNRAIRTGYVIGFVALIVAVLVPIVVRWAVTPTEPSIEIVEGSGRVRSISLGEIQDLPRLCRRGSYENQFGNWRDEGTYCGVFVSELMGTAADYTSIVVAAEDGYHIEIERGRIEDPDYPMVLAFSFEGRTVPEWTDGYRIAVLPEDGGVSNAEYGVDSAGSYWVKNVARLVLNP